MLKEINAHKGIPFQMSNEEIADEMFPFIKECFPDALLVKHDIDEYMSCYDKRKKCTDQTSWKSRQKEASSRNRIN